MAMAADTTIDYRAWKGKVPQHYNNQTPHWNWRKAQQACPPRCQGGEILIFLLSLKGIILRGATDMAEIKPQPFAQLQLE